MHSCEGNKIAVTWIDKITYMKCFEQWRNFKLLSKKDSTELIRLATVILIYLEGFWRAIIAVYFLI